MKNQTIFYCENEGYSSALKGFELEDFYCCADSNQVCFCWIKVKGQNPYRFFVENANACFFEQFSEEEFKEEIEDYRESKELVDLKEKLKLQNINLGNMHIECDLENFTNIKLFIEFESGSTFVLLDNDHSGQGDSFMFFKNKEDLQLEKILI